MMVWHLSLAAALPTVRWARLMQHGFHARISSSLERNQPVSVLPVLDVAASLPKTDWLLGAARFSSGVQDRLPMFDKLYQ
eukprot:jgi/Chrzof1/13410/Cz07g32010.t1